MKQTISVLVENQAGVLNRITGLFSRRAFNIESLAVGVTDDPTISRITIIVDSGNSVVEQVEKQLNKLIEVIKVRTLEDTSYIGRELMILKVNANNKTRQDIMTICEIMGAKVDDISPTSLTLELSDTPDRLDTFQSMMRPSPSWRWPAPGSSPSRRAEGKFDRESGDKSSESVSALPAHKYKAVRRSRRLSSYLIVPI